MNNYIDLSAVLSGDYDIPEKTVERLLDVLIEFAEHNNLQVCAFGKPCTEEEIEEKLSE